MTPAPTEPSPRERLLGRVLAAFAERGVRDTSLRGLAAEIGTSQRMLSYHFGSREGLIAAVIEAVAQADAAMLDDLFATHADPFEAGAENWRRLCEQARIYGALHFELASHAMYGAPSATDLGRVLVTRAEAGFARAYATRADAELAARLARLTVAVGQGLLFDLLLTDERAAVDAAVEEFTAMVRRRLEEA